MMKVTVFLLLFLAIASAVAAGRDNPDAHAHGKANLTLVFEKGQLLMELDAPAANFLGFEHQPRTSQEKRASQKVSQSLRQPDKVLSLQPECKLLDTEVVLPFELSDQGASLDSTGKHRDKSAGQHKHGHEHEHHKSDSPESEHHSRHGDIRTRYEWRCSTPSVPKVNFHYFGLYPGFETLTVQWIVDDSQGAEQLSKHQNLLEIAQ